MDSVFLNLAKVVALLPLFLFLSAVIFYLPGLFLIQKAKTKFRDDEKIVLSFALGMIIFLLIAITSGISHLRFLVPFGYFGFFIYALFKYKNKLFASFLGLFKEKLLMFFLFLGTLVEGFINFPSSFPFKDGHLYWSSQGHDGLWHVAIIEIIKKSFPAYNPLFAGEKLFNYHYFVDVVIAEFNRLFPFFTSLDLYFRYFSFLTSFLMGLAAYSLLTTWTKNKLIGFLGIFFTYFVGSFGYMVLVIQGRGFFGGETIFWAAQGNTIIGNMPHAICYFLLPVFFLSLHHYLKTKKKLFFLNCFLLGGFLVGFKVSAGVVLFAGLAVASFFSIFLKQNRGIILLTGLIGLSNFLSFKAITKGGESLLMFLPWWFIRTMIVVPDRVNWLDLELRRQFYLARGGIRATLRIIEFETIAFFIFLVGNLGIRVLGFWEILKIFGKKIVFRNPLQTSIFVTMLTGFLIPIFFVQKGVTYNLIQFMQYFLLLFGFYAAISLYNFLSLFKSRVLKIVIFSVFFALSIPTVIGNLVEFYGKNPLAIVSNQEIEALSYLKNHTTEKDIILTKPFNPYSRSLYKHQPWPIYAWDSTGYVSAYTGRQTYCTDEGQMRILAINPEERIKKANAFFGLEPVYDQNKNLLHYFPADNIPLEQKAEFLEKENINFIYLRQEETDEVQKETFARLGLEEIFRNEAVVIYKLPR